MAAEEEAERLLELFRFVESRDLVSTVNMELLWVLHSVPSSGVVHASHPLRLVESNFDMSRNFAPGSLARMVGGYDYSHDLLGSWLEGLKVGLLRGYAHPSRP